MIDINKQPDPLPEVLPTGTTWKSARDWGTVDEPLKLDGGVFLGRVPYTKLLTKSPSGGCDMQMHSVADPGCIMPGWVNWPSYYAALEKQPAEPFDPIAYAREKLAGWEEVPSIQGGKRFSLYPPDGVRDLHDWVFVEPDSIELALREECVTALTRHIGRQPEPEWKLETASTRNRRAQIDLVLAARSKRQAELPEPKPEPETCVHCGEVFDAYRRPTPPGVCSNCSEPHPYDDEPLDARIAAAKAEHKAEHPKPVKHPWGAWSTATWDAP